MVSYRVVVVAVLLTAPFPVATASAAAPTKAGWAKAASAVCARENAQIRSLPKVASQTFLSDLKAMAKYATQTVNRLAAIPRPAAQAKLITSMIAKERAQNDLVLRQAIPAVQVGDAATTNRTMGQVGKLGDEAVAIAAKLGATACTANPEPSGNPLAA